MFTEAIEEDPWSLRFVPDHFRTQEIGAEAVHKEPYFLQEIPDHLKTRGYLSRQYATSHTYWNLSLTVSKPKKCVLNKLRKTPGLWNLPLITSNFR